MSKIRLRVDCEPSVIKSQLRKDEKYSQGVRLYAVYQISLGKNSEDLAGLYGTSHKSVCSWVSRYNSEGIEGLKDRRRSGRPSGLSCENRSDLKRAVLESPEKQGYSSGVWTWALVADFISKTFGRTYRKAHIYNILHSLNLSYQKGKGFFPEACDREEKMEDIKKTSGIDSGNSAVPFEDEASLSSTATVSYGWSEKGRQPKISLPQRKKERKTIFGAVNPRTGDLFTQVSDRGDTASFFSFCVQCVQANAGKKIYLVLDSVKYHRAKRLKSILERYSDRIELIFCLPALPT